MNTKQAKILAKHFPPRGPCGACGHGDARHRLFDTIVARFRSGETAEFMAKDYDLPVSAINNVLLFRPYQEKPDA
jgi:hypothetical protein